MAQNPAPRNSFLLSPVVEETRRPKYADVVAASTLFSSHSSSTPVTEPLSTSRSTSHNNAALISHNNAAPTDSAISSIIGANATTGHLPLSTNNYSSIALAGHRSVAPRFPNASQPALGPSIPATRFDTVTSYVDIIYQQQQQQQQQPFLGAHPSQSFGSAAGSGAVQLHPSDGIDGDHSFMATCPVCAMMVMTELEPVLGRKSWLMSALFAPLLMCWVPLTCDSVARRWKDVNHWCPKCRALIAVYRK